MKNSICVIQPSKFEGWSTVIEDAKTMQKLVLASNLDVHLEQLGDKGIYFDPDKVDELAEAMIRAFALDIKEELWAPLEDRTRKFASDFVNALYAGQKA